jgi:hypothetical protein
MFINLLECAELGIKPSEKEKGLSKFIEVIKDALFFGKMMNFVEAYDYESMRKEYKLKRQRINECNVIISKPDLSDKSRKKLFNEIDKLLKESHEIIMQLSVYGFKRYIESSLLNAFRIVRVLSKRANIRIVPIEQSLPPEDMQTIIHNGLDLIEDYWAWRTLGYNKVNDF